MAACKQVRENESFQERWLDTILPFFQRLLTADIEKGQLIDGDTFIHHRSWTGGETSLFFRKTMKEFLLVDLRLSFLRERTRERERNETRPEFKILSFSRRNNASGTKQEVESGKPSIKFLSRVHIFAAHKRVILFVLRQVARLFIPFLYENEIKSLLCP